MVTKWECAQGILCGFVADAFVIICAAAFSYCFDNVHYGGFLHVFILFLPINFQVTD
jgi:hypothetical protein